MPVESVYQRLEPLLPRVRKPIAYVGGEVNSVVKDASLAYAGRAVCVAFHPGWVRTDMGGSGADIDVKTSVAGMRRVVAALSARDNGAFLDYDGKAIAW